MTAAREPRATEPDWPAETLLSSITSGFSVAREPRLVRQRFEEELRALVNATSIAVRECVPGTAARPEVLTFEVPAAPWSAPTRLEAVFEPAQPVDDWKRRTLSVGAQVAALLVELEHADGRWTRLRRGDGAAPLVGSSAAIRDVRERIERVAVTDFTVLIEGESGTGKELVARQIHDLSRRRKGPFVAVNCAAIVETLLEAELFGIEDRTATGVRGRRGKFESAHDGTLFLDEVSDLSPAAQAKLLRAIQDLSVERVGGGSTRRIDTRIIVATNRPLSDLVEQGRFRLDLFYRLNGIDVQVPPLRVRKDDVLELARYFLERLSLRAAVVALDRGCRRPARLHLAGQRQGARASHRAGRGAGILIIRPTRGSAADAARWLRGSAAAGAACRESMRAWGSRYARLVLERCANNKRRACRELGISYHTLQGYLRFRPNAFSQEKSAG